ncbi:MAG: LPP20 family lipoprotein [Selenomonadaceae bacterium]|nr:LPP20 family lipoprotein [Selenomonadaceae bacterium]
MEMFKKVKLLGVLVAAIIFAISATVDAAPNWNTGTIQVTGMGVSNPALARTSAHASMMARRAAVADAYRQLAEAVQGVQVDAETTVEQMMLTSDIVKTRVSAVIRGARIVDEGELAGGGYSVTMEIPLFGGAGGLAETVIERPTYVEPIPMPAPDYRPPVDYTPPTIPDYQPPTRSSGNYTGLVVDCRGLGTLNPVMSPVIKDESGAKIYGHKNLDYDRIIREGMATYAQDMSQASRAGSNPLIVRAVRLDDLNANPVLSMEDSNMVLYENKSSHFLEDIAVVFLY